MERQSSVFGKLRSLGHNSLDQAAGDDEWFIPYNARPNLPTRESGIGLSPVQAKPAHSNLLSVFSGGGGGSGSAANGDRSYKFPRPTPTPSNTYTSAYNSDPPLNMNSGTQRLAFRRQNSLAKSPSYSSISDMIHAQRIPSSSSVPTGLDAPKMLFSPMNREMRAGNGSYSGYLESDPLYQAQPRQRTVSVPRPTHQQHPSNPYEYKAETRRWAVPTMCDMFVLPRPQIVPHLITPPATPDERGKRWSASSGTSASDEAKVVEAGRTRLKEREEWAELIRRRGRSLSLGGRLDPPRDVPVIGNVRARSREGSRNSSLVNLSLGSQGRKRSASFGSRWSSRNGSISRNDPMSRHGSISQKEHKRQFSFSRLNRGNEEEVPKSFGFVNTPAPTRRDNGSASQGFIDDDDVNDPFHSNDRRSDSMPSSAPHAHSISNPELLGQFTSKQDSRYPPPVSVPQARTLQFRHPSVADRGGVVIITKRASRRATLGEGTGTYKAPPPLNLSKPLPQLPDEARSPSLPTYGPFVPLSDEIGVAISPGLPQMGGEDRQDEDERERRASLPDSTTVPSTSSLASPMHKARTSDGGSAHARAFLAKQQQRARTKRAFQSPSQPPISYRQRDVATKGPLSASTGTTTSSTISSPSPSPIRTEGPRRQTALEEAIGRSRAASVGVLDEPQVKPARSSLQARLKPGESSRAVGAGTLHQHTVPPLKISLELSEHETSTMQRALSSPPLAYPNSTMPSPRTKTGPMFDRQITFLDVQRPDFRHSDTATSKATVYTDASEGWDRSVEGGSGRTTPLFIRKISETHTNETPSPHLSLDEGDFHGLFFRTPADRNGSFSNATPIPERYAPSRSASNFGRAVPSQVRAVGLGYGLESPQSPQSGGGTTSTSDDQPRRPSDGSEISTVEITTPDIASDRSATQQYSNFAVASHRTDGHHPIVAVDDQRVTSPRLMAAFTDGRPVTPESIVSRGNSEERVEETHATVMPIVREGNEFPFPHTLETMRNLAEAARTHNATSGATENTPDGKRRSSRSRAALSPGTFGIITQPPPPSSFHHLVQQQQQQPDSPPLPESNTLSPQRSQLTPSPQAFTLSQGHRATSLSPNTQRGVDVSPDPGHERRGSAAVSFFDEFPSPPSASTQYLTKMELPQAPVKHASAFGQLVTGPPGAGKSTYCHGLHQFLTALGRPVHIINLDPAVPSPPYPCSISITELITLDSVMEEYGLGPNGAMLYCVEYLEANFDWLVERLDEVLGEEKGNGYVVFDTPGQVELWTNHDSLKNVVGKLVKMDYRLAAVHLSDAHYITDASKFISVVLLALRAMLQMEMPHVNVLSKIDLISTYGELPFDLSYYTEVQDLSYLLAKLDSEPRAAKFGKLNKAMVELVEGFGLVGFETLAVEDKSSMINLVRLVDKMTGYIFIPNDDDDGTNAVNTQALFGSAMGVGRAGGDVRDVQERWMNNKEEYDEWEKEEWKKEGEMRARMRDTPQQTHDHDHAHDHTHTHEVDEA
ncbi:hypothetical protein IAR55_000434 [Kwoniella newhampshirensis]|uniref:Cytoplasmic protein n=1 Tax=Kwoniella newhampshirensis TaxID=1651941 RepID=A0AAW0Z741_9TREE